MPKSPLDKTVLITGAARGIGYATATEFARAKSTLVLTDLDGEALRNAATELRAHAAAVHTYVMDVSDKSAVDAMATDVLGKLGRLDILINNAGVGYSGPLADTTLETWQKQWAINFWGPLYHVYAFLPSMRARRAGHIVNVSSGQAFFRMPTWGAYATVKVAIAAFSEILRVELAPHGVKVTTVYPYMVNTGFYEQIEPQSFVGKLSMKLVPYYSDSPEKVGHLVFEAVRKKKKVETVSLINDFGYYAHVVRPVADAMSWLTARLLGEREHKRHA